MTPAKPRAGSTLALMSVALFMATLDNLVVSTALPSSAATSAPPSSPSSGRSCLHADLRGPLLTGAALGDRFGRRRMFIIGLIVFTARPLAAALSPSARLITARAVQGIGGAIVTPLT